MKVLFVSNLFPDTAEPIRGLDNARLLHQLASRCEIRVVALRPVPWLWPARKIHRLEPRPEDATFRPRYEPAPYVPKLGSRWNHKLMARSLLAALPRVRREFAWDVALVSWLYPDGCAVSEIAAREAFPFVAIAQGSDAHQYLQMPPRRRAIAAAMRRASAVVGRSREITRRLEEAGVPAARLHAIYNGVDASVYHPADPRAARRDLGLPPDDPVILYVGNFLPIKNPLLAVAAHGELLRSSVPNARLIMLGDGPLVAAVRREVGRHRGGDRIQLVGRQPPARVARYMQAADVLCVPSHNEGLPNVVLEAFACGLRVVSTRVGGIPEVLGHEWLGRLVPPANPAALSLALSETLRHAADPERICRHAEPFSWERTAQAHFDLLEQAWRSR